MVKKYVRKIRTTAGNEYIVGRIDRGLFIPSRSGKRYKSRARAEKSIK